MIKSKNARLDISDDGNVGALLGDNAMKVSGGALALGLGTSSLLICTVAMPAQFLGAGSVAAALYIAGSRQAQGKSILPSFGNKDQSSTTDTAAPAPEAA